MSKVGAWTRHSASAARSGRPPRDTTASIQGSSAAAISAAAAPVDAPKSPIRRPLVSGKVLAKLAAAFSRSARRPMLNRNSAVARSTRSSSAVSRSIRRVAMPAS